MREKTILLVEDNPDDVELTLLAFKKNKILNEVQLANDGEQALDYLLKRGKYSGDDPGKLPSVILLDLNLPKVNGFEVLKELRENPSTKIIPVVILTSSKEEEDLVKGYTLGANSYIRKPVDFHDFVAAVQQLGLYWLLLNEIPPSKK